MVWGSHQEDYNYAGITKETKGRRPNESWLDNIREDMKEYNITD